MDKKINTIVERVKQRRMELGYSYQTLAELTGMSSSTLQRYESGAIKNIPLSRLKILASGLSTPPEWLMGFDVPRESSEWYVDSIAITPFDQALLRAFYNASSERKSIICELLGVPKSTRIPNEPAAYITKKNDWEE